MPRRVTLFLAAVALAIGCSEDRPAGLLRISAGSRVAVDTPPANTTDAKPLPQPAPLAKEPAELQSQGWTAAEPPPELAMSLRDTISPGLPPVTSPVIEEELRTRIPSGLVRPFDSLGGFADTARLVERALIRMGREWLAERERAIVDSLRRAMEPRDPDLDAVRTGPAGLLPPPGEAPVQPSTWQEPAERGTLRVVPAAFGSSPQPAAATQQQGGQTRTFQLAPGIEGKETISPDGSTMTMESSMKGSNAHGSAEASGKATTTAPEEFERRGEVGSTQDIDTRQHGTLDGNTVEQTKGFGSEERLGYCPDATGIVRGRYKHWIRESTTGTIKGITGEYRLEIQGDFALTVQVDDQARATELLVEGHATVEMYGGQRGGGNSTPLLVNGRGEGRAQGVSLEDNSSLGSLYIRLPPAGPGSGLKIVQAAVFEELGKAIGAARILAQQAEQRWRNGACVEVIATPKSKPLRYGQSATFQAEVRHKRDAGSSFPYPVRAMAKKWGTDPTQVSRTYGTLSPADVATAPIAYHYTAPAKGTQAAKLWRTSLPPVDDVFLVSVSRRGIGVDAVHVPYDSLRRTYHIVYHHRTASQKRGPMIDAVYRAVLRELDVEDEAGNTFVGTGDYTVTARLWKANCMNNFPDDYQVISGGGTVRASGDVVEMGKSSEGITFALESVGGPRMQLFTRSFSGLEQRFRQEVTQSGGEDAIPLIAPGAGGFVELRGRSGDTTRVLTIGQNECEGELTTAFAVRVTRLR